MRYYLVDALGSIIALTDEVGTVVTQYVYEPFGKTTVIGEISDNAFQYTGRENDGTGLYYYRARYYNPELQRFVSEDPIGLKGGINKFTYVKNNPVKHNDAFGLLPPGYWLDEGKLTGKIGPFGGSSDFPTCKLDCDWKKISECILLTYDFEQWNLCKDVCEMARNTGDPKAISACGLCLIGKSLEIADCLKDCQFN